MIGEGRERHGRSARAERRLRQADMAPVTVGGGAWARGPGARTAPVEWRGASRRSGVVARIVHETGAVPTVRGRLIVPASRSCACC
jgi:hypothetical protein